MASADVKANASKLGSNLGLDSFDVGVTLGTGSFGRVRFGTHKVG